MRCHRRTYLVKKPICDMYFVSRGRQFKTTTFLTQIASELYLDSIELDSNGCRHHACGARFLFWATGEVTASR